MEPIPNENIMAGTVAEHINVEAQQVAGRDIYNYQTTENSEIQSNERLTFSTIDATYYPHESFLKPKFTHELCGKLSKSRVIILSGGPGFDKGTFIRNLAVLVQVTQYEKHRIKEMQSNTENQSILKAIRQNDDHLIYALEQMHPKHFDYEIEKLTDLAEDKDLYFIISTDISINSWELQLSQTNRYSFIIPPVDLYEQETLFNFFKDRFSQKKEVLSKVISLDFNDVLDDAIMGYPIADMVQKFQTPENIVFFISLLVNQQDPIDTIKFKELIEETVDFSQPLITRWFRTLDNRQKLIALSISLLEGMYDDQYFSITSHIVDKFWKYSDSSLQALDYVDLEFLSDYFKMEPESNGYQQRLKNRFPNQRTDIIKAAWQTHRRHILSVMPTLVNIVNDSVHDKASDWEKYGTLKRQMNIRTAISKSMADIGLVSIHAVENSLIELAGQNNETLQRVAAKALARWREYEQDEQLFQVLNDWLSDNRIQKILNEFLAKRTIDSGTSITARSGYYLKDTAVMALSYAAAYDSPNQLNMEIINILKMVLDDRDERLRKVVSKALPTIIHHHILQLKEVLIEDLIRYDDLAEIIADGLVKGYGDYPEDLKNTMFQWLEDCYDEISLKNRRNKLTYRDKVLVTILNTFQNIDYADDIDHPITVSEVYVWITKFNAVEGRTEVREALFQTLGVIIYMDWSKTQEYLPKFFSEKNKGEISYIAEKMLDIYINQRIELQGAKYTMQYKEKQVPIWLSMNQRPQTDIEKVLLQWAIAKDPLLRELSFTSLLIIAKDFEEQEYETIYDLNRRLAEEAAYKRAYQSQNTVKTTTFQKVPAKPKIVISTVENNFSLWMRLIIWLMMWGEPKGHKEVLKTMLKMVLAKRDSYKLNYFNNVFQKWRKSESDLTVKLSKWIPRLMH